MRRADRQPARTCRATCFGDGFGASADERHTCAQSQGHGCGDARRRHGDRNAPIFRKGGVYKGPSPRSHAHDLPKKFRKLGLRHALSAKAGAGELVILDTADLGEAKTKVLAKLIKDFGWKRALVIDGETVNENFARAARNIDALDVLPSVGANVYDILKRETLVLTKAGVEALEARLK